MNRSRLLTLLAVFILSMVLVTAVMAAADATRQKAVLAEGIQESILEPGFSIPADLDAKTFATAFRTEVATAPAVKISTASAPAIAAPPQIAYKRGLPPDPALTPPTVEGPDFDLVFSLNSGGAPRFASESGVWSAQTPPMPRDDNFVIDKDDEAVWGVVNPGETVTVTYEGSQVGAAVADGVGFFFTRLYDSNGDRPPMTTGDTVAIYVEGVQQASIDLPNHFGVIDYVEDTVTGQVSDNSFDVTVYANGRSMTSYWVTTTLDASGFYTADFSTVYDFKVWDSVFVAAVKDGVEVHWPFVGSNSLLVRVDPWNWAMGRAEPNTPVTVTLFESGGSPRDGDVLNADVDGFWLWESGTVFNESDYVQAEFEGGAVLSRTVDHLTASMDATNDRLTGECDEAGAEVRGHATALTEEGWRLVQATTTADGSGYYTLEFGMDISPIYLGSVFIADAEGDDLNLPTHDAYLHVNQTWETVEGAGPLPIGQAEGVTVTVTFDSVPGEFVTEMDWRGRFFFDPEFYPGFPDIGPGEVVTAVVQGDSWQGLVPVDTVTASPDVDNDRITGEVTEPTDRVDVLGSQWGWNGIWDLFPIAGTFDTVTTANSPYTATPPGFDIRNAVSYSARHYTSDDGIDEISGNVDYLRIWPGYNGTVGSISPPGTAFTITLKEGGGATKAVLHGTSQEPTGSIGFMNFWETGVLMEFGDILEVQAGTGFSQSIQIPVMDLQFDMAGDRITGNVLPNVQLFVEVGGQGRGFVPTQANGDYAVALDQLHVFNGDGELAWGNWARVCYAAQTGNQICYDRNWPYIVARYTNMGWNDVFGSEAVPGNTILITVTDEVSDVVATGETIAGDCQDCSPWDYQYEFTDGTIAAGNRVTVNFGDDLVDFVDVVSITVEVDMDADIITVTVPPDSWISVWGDDRWGGGRVDFDNIQVGATGVISFNFGNEGHDILPGDNFHVYVQGRNNHQTEYIHSLPYTELQLYKSGQPGHPMPGFPYIYRIEYWNHSDWEAEDVIITDALPMSTTYAGDTSGFAVEDGGSVVTWTVGAVPPWSYQQFYVAVDVDPSVPLETNLEANCAWIKSTTMSGDDPGDNWACTGEQWVGEGETGLWIDKWPEPGDPHPGQIFQYVIDYGSDGGVAAGPAWLTDTLPAGTTFIDWYDEQGWEELWQVVSTEGVFALYAPAGIPGDMGGRIRLTLLLNETAEISTTLENHVIITPTNKVDNYPENNEDFDDSAHISEARYDLSVGKWVHNQVPIPGEWVNFFVHFQNNGNIETNVVLTDVFDSGLSFDYAHWGGNQPFENEPFPDPTINGNELVWDLGSLGVGESKWFHIQMNISEEEDPGNGLSNCITIDSGNEDSNPGDNESCFTIVLNEPGPNLRVWKEYDWRSYPNRLRYWLNFENLGDTTISNVFLTDTMPISTTWEGWWDMEFEWERLVSESLNDDQMVWEFSELYPGDRGTMHFSVLIDDPWLRPMWYTNTAEITVPSEPSLDTNPDDNRHDAVAVLGEVQEVELWVNQDHSDMWGSAQPGRALTVTTAVSETYAFAEWDCGGCWSIGDIGPVWPGDVLTVTSGDGLLPITFTVPEPFTTEADSATEMVWGQVDSRAGEEVLIQLYDGGTNYETMDENGAFSTAFPGMWRGANGYVRYEEEVSQAFVRYHNRWSSPDLLIQVNYGHDWVNGSYEQGHTVWITVTESDSTTVKATAQLTTGFPEGWDQPGFSTQDEDWNGGQRPDIIPGDWVFASVDTGFSTEVHVGIIEGAINLDADSITGVVSATWWLPDPVQVACEAWGNGGEPNKWFGDLLPNGSDEYTCVWDHDTEWDIQPNQDVAVRYQEPDGDSVYNVFNVLTPEIRINKQGGPGHPMPGYPYIYQIQYWNDNEGEAENVVISDTLPVSTTYAGDTSGFLVDVNGRLVTWTVGTVEPNSYHQFYVAVDVDPGVLLDSELDQNCASISTTSIGDDPENNYTCSGTRWVGAGETGVWVDKWPEPGDPHPGQIFQYVIDYGSDGGVAAGPAWLTDTLPAGTTFVDWYDENGWDDLWQVMSTEGTFALYAPAGIPGDMGGRIRLTLLLNETAEISTTLENHVIITTTNKVDDYPFNNEDYDNEAHVSEARYDLGVDKRVHNQVPIPGEWVNFFVHFQNNGNIETNVVLTDVFDSGLSYDYAFWGGNQPFQNEPFPDPTINGNELVWDLGSLGVGESKWFHIQMNISEEEDPGNELSNCIRIDSGNEDSYPGDNESCATIVLNEPGPNLRVWKEYDWQPYPNRLRYWLNFENLGNTIVSNVFLTDTMPISTTYDWWYDMDGIEWERMISESLDDDQLVWEFSELYPGDRGTMHFSVGIDDPWLRPMWYTNTAEITVPSEPSLDTNPDDNRHDAVAVLGEVQEVELWVNQDHSDMWGSAQPGRALTVTTAVSETYAFAEWDCGGCWSIGDIGPVWPGDVLTVTSGDGLLPITFTVPEPFTTEADSATEMVWGQVDSRAGEEVLIQLYDGGTNYETMDENGAFSTTFPGMWRGANGHVRYEEEVSHAFVRYHNRWSSPDLVIQVNYGHDWVNGNYEVGHTVWLTVTESDSTTVKATAQLTTGFPEGWDQPGFSTQDEDWDGGQRPDIIPGDWVFGSVDTGFSTEVHVGIIEGAINLDADSITGVVSATWWLPDPVQVACEAWGNGGEPNKWFGDLLPNGSDEYTCVWDHDTEWDIQPNQDVAVRYQEPDGDSVYNVFYEPTSNLSIEKWRNGEPAAGSNYAFTVRFWNGGEAAAENVVISDTLDGNMSYLSDTSEFSISGSNPYVWDVGTVEPGEEFQFLVFVEVTGSPGELLTNTVQIDSSTFDTSEQKFAQVVAEIQENSTDVNIGKNSWTEDPAPGEEFIWELNACNGGNTGSATVTLTDTLPLSTTLSDIWLGGSGWTVVSQDSQEVVFSRPTIESYGCEQIHLVLLVDPLAEPGQMISNTAVIFAPNDTYTENNVAYQEVYVAAPHTNLAVDKWWNWGQLVEGGMASYGIQVRNEGNTAVNGITLTDTLPVDSYLMGVWAYTRNWDPVGEVPTTQIGNQVIWNGGSLSPGDSKNFEIQIAFDPEIGVGTVVTNRVEVSPQPEEDSYEDNYSEHVEEIFGPGPNLRVTKWGDWQNYDEFNPMAAYNLQIENVGDEMVAPVVVLDTYPAELRLEGDVQSNYDRWWEWRDHPSEHYFTVTLQELQGGESWGIWFNMVPDPLPIPGGLVLTNTATITVDPGDTNPDDNQSSVVLTTGPDMWVKKKWVGGEAAPGEEITFEIQFGNMQPGHHWWWGMNNDAWISDTLPTGMEFVTSTLSYCPWLDQEWCGIDPNINGNELGWRFWPLSSGEEYAILLTVRISDTALPGDSFGNFVEISSDVPAEDLDPDPSNNWDTEVVEIPCTPITEISFTYIPAKLFINELVTFTLTITPSDASEPFELTWDFDDSTVVPSSNLVEEHTYTTAGFFVPNVTASNACSAGIYYEEEIWVASMSLWVPLVMR